jgi:hypothetical protein
LPAVYVNIDGKEKSSLISPFGFFKIVFARYQKRKKKGGERGKERERKKMDKEGERPL